MHPVRYHHAYVTCANRSMSSWAWSQRRGVAETLEAYVRSIALDEEIQGALAEYDRGRDHTAPGRDVRD